jgi:acyl-CoA synthetase (AMP-forming)/AMP-acid ligase II
MEVAVIGVPDERWGESVKAVVSLHPGAEATEEDLIGYCREHLAGFKCPRSVDVLDALPRNPTGKILKRELREMAVGGEDEKAAVGGDDEKAAVGGDDQKAEAE